MFSVLTVSRNLTSHSEIPTKFQSGGGGGSNTLVDSGRSSFSTLQTCTKHNVGSISKKFALYERSSQRASVCLFLLSLSVRLSTSAANSFRSGRQCLQCVNFVRVDMKF